MGQKKRRVEDSQKFVKKLRRNAQSDRTEKLVKIAKKETHYRAASLMLLLGQDDAAAIMSRMSDVEAEKLARNIARIRRIEDTEAEKLLKDFGNSIGEISVKRVAGGMNVAREILEKAFGPSQADEILLQSVPESRPKPFYFLDDLTDKQLISLLRKENPRTLALVLSFMNPVRGSCLLESLPKEDRITVALRMARIAQIPTHVVATVETALQEKIRKLSKRNAQEIDGRSVLAEMLRHMKVEDEHRLLHDLQGADAALVDEVKEKLYTMDSIMRMRATDLQNILLEMDEKTIALILKGQSEEVQDYINNALSPRRRLIVADEGDLMGLVPRREADAAAHSFLQKILKGEENGTYMIIRENEDLIT